MALNANVKALIEGKNKTLVVRFKSRKDDARKQIFNAVLEATTDVFVEEIASDARAMSPVGDEPVDANSKRNRDSIETKVYGTKKGPGAKIFTTSGHGGFLEVGTKKMAAQPYIYPAVQQNIGKIPERVKELVDAVTEDENKAEINADTGRDATG